MALPPPAGKVKPEANKIAEIDVKARARVIWSAEARTELLFFFIAV